MYCPTSSLDFVESLSCTVPIWTCTVQKMNLICRKNPPDLDIILNSPFRNNDLVLPLNFNFLGPKKTPLIERKIVLKCPSS